MDEVPSDLNQMLMLDGNALAGTLYEIFALEMTTSLAECASCGQQGQIGYLKAYTQAPGAVLRCPVCANVVMRIVETPQAIYLDARGATYIRLERPVP